MNVEELINKKKEEIIEEVKSETEGLHESISNTAVEKLEKFAAELKMAIDMNPIGAQDLLKVIEKGGLVLKKEVDVKDRYGRTISLDDFMEDVIAFEHRGRRLDGKQGVTLIIEPMEE